MDASTKNDTSSTKTGLESLSKEELINKYKSLLNIAKKAKQAKDEIAEENRLLQEALQRNETQKEADKKALMTMKETLEQFTEQKLLLSTQLDELRQQNRHENELLEQMRIENESLRRQMASLTADNESLLNDMDAMENQLKQVNVLSMEQKKHLELLELEINRLKERECQADSLEQQLLVSLAENKALKEQENLTKKSLNELTAKYKHIKEINTEQRQKFNVLKERFVEVNRKLKNLKECKRILLETQKEYAEAVTKWQNEIINAARQLCEQLESLKAENEELTKKLTSKNCDFGIENAEILVKIDGYLNDLENLAIVGLKEEAIRKAQSLKQLHENAKSEENVTIDCDNEKILEKLCTTKAVVNDLEAKLEKQSKSYADLESQYQHCQVLNTKLSNECESLKESIKNYELQIAENVSILDSNSKLENDLKNLNRQFEQKSQAYEKLTNEVTSGMPDNNEIAALKAQLEQNLMEKSEIESKNQYLIEKLEMLAGTTESQNIKLASNEKLLVDLTQNVDDLHKYRQLYDELQAKHESKAREHADLLGEMRELNEALKKRGDLISRQEAQQNELNMELKRLQQQLEQSKKEKEQILQQKDLELQQINAEVKATQAHVEQLTTACDEKEAQFSALTLELQNLKQNSLNKTNDDVNDTQSDVISIASNISRADELNRLKEVDTEQSWDERYNKLKTLAMKLKKKLQEQTAHANDLSEQLQANAKALKAQQQLNENLTTENKKLINKNNKSNMLNLEIEAAEKSLSELSAKLTAKSNELKELKLVLDTKESTIKQLRQELVIVEAAKAAECEHAKELKVQIDLMQAQIKAALHDKQLALDGKKEQAQTNESNQLEIEDLRLKLAKQASEQSLKLEALTNDNSQLQTKLNEMEAKLQTTQQKLKMNEDALAALRLEHADYKVKAQAVFRKQQTKDTTHEHELADELAMVRQQHQQMEILTQNLKAKIESNEKQLEIITGDNESLKAKNVALFQLNDELSMQNEALTQAQSKLMQAHQQALSQQRQQIENLNESHQMKTQRLENEYQNEIEKLKMELKKQTTTAVPPTTTKQFAENHSMHLMAPREAGEGSESFGDATTASHVITLQNLSTTKRKISNTTSTMQQQQRHQQQKRSSMHELMPLDELLNAPMNALNSETLLSSANNNRNDFDDDADANYDDDDGSGSNFASNNPRAHLELQAAKARLQTQESRLRHLTALLAENEQDLAKLTQMNDMLKEELRRQERSEEREQHMHNSEYLKNVFIKFITLNSVDERTRLVPVLNTILKLSRSEVEMLNCVAKGQKVTEHPRSWSSFLPTWGSNTAGNN